MTDGALPIQPTTNPLGWLSRNRWLLLRRLSQAAILGLFLLGPVAGVRLIEGSLSASKVLETVPLTDPLLLWQSMSSGIWPTASGLLGALIVLAFYALVGGRVFCAWVCPLNPVTDLAAWLRRRLDLGGGGHLSRQLRYWVLGTILLLPPLTGVLAWELVSPVSLFQRGLLFGMGWTWTVVLAVFLFDLLVVRHGWCGHLCPVGAFYGLVGSSALVRVTASGRERCDNCMDCFAVCPEPQVIRQPLKGAADGVGPVILDRNCTNCGRCQDVCARGVFRFGPRWRNPEPSIRSSRQSLVREEREKREDDGIAAYHRHFTTIGLNSKKTH